MKTIVIDDGSTQLKATFRDENGKIISQVTSSRGENELKNGNDWAKFADSAYRTDNGEYTIGDNLENPMPSNIKSHQTSELARCAVHDALRQAGFGGQSVNVIVTLPVGRFARQVNGSAVDMELIEAKKKAIAGKIEAANPDVKLAVIKSVGVAPEAIPAFMDHATDDDGEWKNGFSETSQVVTIDIGGTTTDVAVFEGGGMIKNTYSIEYGVLSMNDKLKAGIMEKTGHSTIRPQWVEDVIRNGTAGGNDFSDLLKTCRRQVFNNIRAELERQVPAPEQFDLVLAIGGGAEVFREELAQWSGAVVTPKDPVCAVARGLLKIKGI